MNVMQLGMDAVIFVGLRVVGPYLVGIITVLVFHYGTGAVLIFASGEDDDKLDEWKKGYLVTMFKVKDLIFVWALGIVVFMLIGLI